MLAKDLTDCAVYGKVPREGPDPRLLVKQVRHMYALPFGQDFKLSLHILAHMSAAKLYH